MELKTPEEAKEYLDILVEYSMEKDNKTLEEATALWLNNIGYFAGYYDSETRSRVYEIFDTKHSIFGAEEPTTKEALVLGLAL